MSLPAGYSPVVLFFCLWKKATEAEKIRTGAVKPSTADKQEKYWKGLRRCRKGGEGLRASPSQRVLCVSKGLVVVREEAVMAPTPIVGRPALVVAFSEARRNWPFVFGFGVTVGLILKLSTSLDPADAQKSSFVNPNAHK